MKNRSIRFKLTIWFSSALILATLITFLVVFSVGWSVLQKMTRDNLVRTVEDNVDEVEFYTEIAQLLTDDDADEYIVYANGFLEIDDDFLDLVNGVYTALYSSEDVLLYGENPIYDATAELSVQNGHVREVKSLGVDYYVYDRQLSGKGLEGLWLRGVVSERQGMAPLSDVVRICLILLPSLAIIAIIGGILTTGRALRPLRKMVETVAQITGGSDLKKRIPIEIPGDEPGKLARAVNDMMDRLENSFEAERQFTSDVSHELRTPLSVILAQCDFTLEEERSSEQYRDALQLIRRQGRLIARITADMLELLRMENRKDAYRRDTIELSELVRSSAEDMSLLQENGITLTWQAEAGLRVQGDPTLLSRMLHNLISNAYRYGRKDGHIHVSLKAAPGGSELAVSDDGIGIAPEQQEKIFRRFYQVSPTRNGTSSGLGLAMVRQIAVLHGGDIRVQSALGQGSTFTVFLPDPKINDGE